ncbi:MAG: Maf family protein [Kofleriaceae bacterium]
MTLYLASASPRRRELLARVGVSFVVAPADVDETQHAGEAPLAYVARVAAAKASAIAVGPGDWVLAADTIVVDGDDVLGKPVDGVEAAAMLRRLAGRSHRVTTAFVVRGAAHHAEAVTTEVELAPLTEAEVAGYVASGEWRGKAGGYALQGIAGGFVRRVTGSVTGVVGLPLAEVLAALRALGAPGADLAAGQPA